MGILVAAFIAAIFIGAFVVLFFFSLKMYRISHARKKRDRLLAAELMARESEAYYNHMHQLHEQQNPTYDVAAPSKPRDIDADSSISGEADMNFRGRGK